jgi:hypothetical protein
LFSSSPFFFNVDHCITIAPPQQKRKQPAAAARRIFSASNSAAKRISFPFSSFACVMCLIAHVLPPIYPSMWSFTGKISSGMPRVFFTSPPPPTPACTSSTDGTDGALLAGGGGGDIGAFT